MSRLERAAWAVAVLGLEAVVVALAVRHHRTALEVARRAGAVEGWNAGVEAANDQARRARRRQPGGDLLGMTMSAPPPPPTPMGYTRAHLEEAWEAGRRGRRI